jgi:hypothetical protein
MDKKNKIQHLHNYFNCVNWTIDLTNQQILNHFSKNINHFLDYSEAEGIFCDQKNYSLHLIDVIKNESENNLKVIFSDRLDELLSCITIFFLISNSSVS